MTFASSKSGGFGRSASCTLQPKFVQRASECSVTYVPEGTGLKFRRDWITAVYGGDANYSGGRGVHLLTVYKPLRSLARMAAGSAVSLARGQPVSSLVKVNNGLKEIPASLIDPISVDKGNLDVTVIADGYHTKAEGYRQ